MRATILPHARIRSLRMRAARQPRRGRRPCLPGEAGGRRATLLSRHPDNLSPYLCESAASSGEPRMTDLPHRVFYLSGGDLLRADDATLASALMANAVRAPRVAWTRFAPMVHRMLKRAFGPGHDIEDMVQDVFLCLFKKVEGLREPKALKSFVI